MQDDITSMQKETNQIHNVTKSLSMRCLINSSLFQAFSTYAGLAVAGAAPPRAGSSHGAGGKNREAPARGPHMPPRLRTPARRLQWFSSGKRGGGIRRRQEGQRGSVAAGLGGLPAAMALGWHQCGSCGRDFFVRMGLHRRER
jgi:hypothetical protein